MKRVTITRAFLAIIIIASLLVGGVLGFIFINPNILGFISSDGRVTISQGDYDDLAALKQRYSKAEYIRNKLENEFYTTVDSNQLDEYMLKGLVSGLDDIYSGYYTKSEYDELLISLTGEYDGVGITMVQSEEGYIEVLAVSKNSPAEKGGVQIGEYIIKVDGTPYTGETMDLAASCVRGKAGTQVEITFLSNGEEIVRTFTRAHIVAVSVDSKLLDDNIAYIEISSFENSTADAFKEELQKYSKADALIIDLRDNPGGLVDSAIDIADMLMDSATMVYIEDHNGGREYYSTKNGKDWTKPFVVLVNESSASASEIFAAGIKENKAGLIIGTKTYGKGVIQSLEELTDGSALKLTMWQYFTPSGEAIHKLGITPDIVVENDGEEDLQLKRAVEELKAELENN